MPTSRLACANCWTAITSVHEPVRSGINIERLSRANRRAVSNVASGKVWDQSKLQPGLTTQRSDEFDESNVGWQVAGS